MAKMKISEIIAFYQACESTALQAGFSRALSYAVEKNRLNAEKVYKAAVKVEKDSPDFLEYLKSREELVKVHAKKTPDGNFIPTGDGVLLENAQAYEKAILELTEKHKATLDEIAAFKDGEDEIKIHQVPIDAFPDNPAPGLLRRFWPMIAEPEA